LLNGPPRAGKDSLAKILQGHLATPASVFRFSEPLKSAVHRAFGVPQNRPEMFESTKDDPAQGPRPGVTWRQVYIAYSEQFLKPLFGEQIFGELLRDNLEASGFEETALISDSGFESEAQVLLARWPNAVRLIRVHRPGFDFKGDSRSYFTLPVPTMDVTASSLSELRLEAVNRVLPFLRLELEHGTKS
jgi:hypothetical protein